MLNKDDALKLIGQHVENKNIVKHMLALEVVMGELWEKLQKDGTKEEWKLSGLLHDGDYCAAVPPEKQGIQIVEWARASGYEISDNVAHAIAAHNFSNTKVEPENCLDWSIFCADSLTGLIVACALVRPSKKLSEVTVESVLKKFGQKSFAAGTRREDIKMCEEKLGITLEEFIKISLKAMQSVSKDLGL
jgi:predicted hydrolase (HD superfamily)